MNSNHIPTATNTNSLLCICGDFLYLTVPGIYGPRCCVYCDICHTILQSNDIIYHCNKWDDICHANGFDLCNTCARYNVTACVILPRFLKIFSGDNQKKIAQITTLYRERNACSFKIHCDVPQDKLLNNSPLNQQTEDTLNLYNVLFGEMFCNPSLLSPIFYDTEYKQIDSIIEILIQSIIPNPFSFTHQHILTQLICDVIRYEFHQTQDLTIFLRENSPASKLFSIYLQREPIRSFVDNLVNEACCSCLDDYKENVDIDPSALLEDDSNAIEERKKKLMQCVDCILSKILNVDQYPISLKIICKTLSELTVYKEQKQMQWIGGFLFLRIFSPKIICYGIEASIKEKYIMYKKNIRRKFMLISKILQNIANQIESSKKEKWMTCMNDYIFSQFVNINRFITDLCHIPSLNSYLALYTNMRYDERQQEFVCISINDLTSFTNILSDSSRLSTTPTSKRFYEVLSDIMDTKSCMSQQKYRSHFVKIMARIPAKHRNKQCSELRSKIIPVFTEISQMKDVIHKYNATKHLMSDITGLLQYIHYKNIKTISNLKQLLDILIDIQGSPIIENTIWRLYGEYALNMDVYHTLSKEINEMT